MVVRGILFGIIFVSCVSGSSVAQVTPDPSKTILIELFTSHGCDMCPGAGRLLSKLPADGYGPDRVAILAWHVDYFNDPWKDPFSKKEYSGRNWAYHTTFEKRDKSSPNLYFTPMIMVDGRYPTSGFFHEGENAARQALHQRIEKAISDPVEARITLGEPTEENGTVRRVVRFEPLSNRLVGSELLLGTAVVEDDISTKIPSGENAGKTLVDYWVVRSFLFQKVAMKRGGGEVTIEVALEPNAKPEKSRVVVFLQDEQSGAVFAATQSAWAPDQVAELTTAK
jgi:hypothetical protein